MNPQAPRQTTASLLFNALAGALHGLIMALLGLLVGLIRIVIALASGVSIAPGELGLIVYYVGAFAAAGAVGGLLWPLRRWVVGRYLLGIVVASVGMLILGIAESGPISQWDDAAWIAASICAVVFGITLGHAFGVDPMHLSASRPRQGL